MAKASTKKTTTKKAPLRKRARTKKGHYIGIGIGVLLIALAVLGS